MIYGPLDVRKGDITKYYGKQVKLADSIKSMRKSYLVRRLHEITPDTEEDFPYNGYRYMEPLEEKSHLDCLLENLEYLKQVYNDCVCTIIRDAGNEEDKRQMEEVLNELKYLLSSRNKVEFITKLFPEYSDIKEIETGREITSLEELDTENLSYKVTILAR